MVNTLITPSIIARAGIATLYAQTQMAGLVHRDFEAEFAGKVGDTITVRKPATFVANEYNRATGIVLQDTTEDSTTVTLNKFIDVSFAVTSEDWTLTVTDFKAQFLDPAMEAISQKVDAYLMAEAANVSATTAAVAAPNQAHQLLNAGTVLTKANVPLANRVTVLSPDKANEYLKDPSFANADKRGDTQGLIEASIGRKYGFDNYESQNAATGAGLAFHRDAFALVTRTLEVPRGVAANQAAVSNYKGLGLRVIYNYDSNKKQDVVSIDLLVGTKTLDASKAVVLSAAAPVV